MTDEQQRIKIAETCGWTDFSRAKHEGAIQYGRKPLSCSDSWEVPDYLNDLNAMHEAEKVLTAEQRRSYVNCIFNLPVSECESNTFATAAQRAKAFLRAIGKWEDKQ